MGMCSMSPRATPYKLGVKMRGQSTSSQRVCPWVPALEIRPEVQGADILPIATVNRCRWRAFISPPGLLYTGNTTFQKRFSLCFMLHCKCWRFLSLSVEIDQNGLHQDLLVEHRLVALPQNASPPVYIKATKRTSISQAPPSIVPSIEEWDQ